jgi:hypothetical protein
MPVRCSQQRRQQREKIRRGTGIRDIVRFRERSFAATRHPASSRITIGQVASLPAIVSRYIRDRSGRFAQASLERRCLFITISSRRRKRWRYLDRLTFCCVINNIDNAAIIPSSRPMPISRFTGEYSHHF